MKVYWWTLFQFVMGILIVASFIYPTSRDLGVLYRKTHLIDESLEQLEAALAANPDSRITMENLASIYGMMGDYAEQVRLLERLLERYPYNNGYADQLSKIYLWQGEYRKNSALLSTRYRKNPDASGVFDQLRASYTVLGDYVALARLLEEYRSTHREDFPYQNDLLYSYMVTKNYDSLLVGYSRMIRKYPHTFSYVQNLLQIQLHLGHPDKAAEIMAAYLKRNDGEMGWRNASRFYTWTDNVLALVTSLRERIRRFEGNDSLVLRLARLERDRSRNSTALELYRDYMERRPENSEAVWELVQLLEWSGKQEEQRELLETMLATHPDSRKILEKLAQLAEWSARYEQALSYHQFLLDMESDPPAGKKEVVARLEKIARLFEWNQNQVSAIATLQELEKLSPSRRRRAHLAQLLEWENRIEESLQLQLAEDSSSLELKLHIASLYGALGKDSLRTRALEDVLYELEEKDRIVALAEVAAWHSGRRDGLAAVSALRQLQKLQPTAGRWFRRSGELLLWAGRFEEAADDLLHADALGEKIPQLLQELARSLVWGSFPRKGLEVFSILHKKSPRRRGGNLFHMAEALAMLKQSEAAERVYRACLIRLRERERNPEEEEQFFLVAAHLNEYAMLSREIHRANLANPLVQSVLPGVLSELLAKGRYPMAVQLMEILQAQRIPLSAGADEQLLYAAAALADNGRWDMARQLGSFAGEAP